MSVPTQLLMPSLSLLLLVIPVNSAATELTFDSGESAAIRFTEKDVEETNKEEKEMLLSNLPEKRDTQAPKKIKRENDKFRIRDYDVCIPGRENINACNSNPDQEKCTDGTYPIDRQILDKNGHVILQFRYCPGEPPRIQVPEEIRVEPERIIITIEKFRTYPIKGSEIQSAPNKFSLRNGHTHFWASENTQEFNSNLSGSNVRIKAIPIQWNWNYGDGAKRNLSFPGEAMPSHTLHDETATSHSYSETGKFDVRVTTLYRGEFSVEGGPWQAIPGQAAVPSNTLPIDVWRTKKELIAND
ncbi:PKD domain-containing protein [Arthrobacter sp. NIO-1057]|uniref:PKD domain-containing protein n=1 Tax=Arthrobacter sp. NIO-1057 TaxID=993071 RepID=UPI00071C23E4|nr:PKD domain-containing protein [Arthrobacter sp. NIO-1057]KSU68186.1 hypothetical protein AS038_03640 [Arthrobacter sp. NIO-1057]SCB91122.1 hypothetical protein GA0061084_0740 [Arthrobacter sp. NIO-1057]